MKEPFEILEHTADVGLRAWGASPAELFESAAAALLAISYERETVVERESREIAADGADRESLMVNWLQEIVWLIDGEWWLPRRVSIREISDTSVRGTAHGEPRDAARHKFNVIVKAVTYHQLKVGQEAGRWRAEVFLDI
jgi:SHS2 domain-containing protein